MPGLGSASAAAILSIVNAIVALTAIACEYASGRIQKRAQKRNGGSEATRSGSTTPGTTTTTTTTPPQHYSGAVANGSSNGNSNGNKNEADGEEEALQKKREGRTGTGQSRGKGKRNEHPQQPIIKKTPPKKSALGGTEETEPNHRAVGGHLEGKDCRGDMETETVNTSDTMPVDPPPGNQGIGGGEGGEGAGDTTTPGITTTTTEEGRGTPPAAAAAATGAREPTNPPPKQRATNNRPPPKKRKNDETAYWCFTWNNPPEGYEDSIRLMYEDDEKDIEYLVYGREVGESGTFHLQGFVQFGTPIQNDEINTTGPAQRLFQAHWTKARRVQKAREYCLKDGKFTEHGDFCMRKGKRTDLDEFKKAVEHGGMTPKIARREYSEVCARYHRFVEAYINDNREKPKVPDHEMYPWQAGLMDRLENHEPDPREIMFVVDTVGNTGKSWFAQKVTHSETVKAQYMTPGKVQDMAYALDEAINVLLMDCPRSRMELFQYDFIEYVKNGLVFNTKYESRMKLLGPCHVVVFMNEAPDTLKLSEDRYTVIRVDDELSKGKTEETKDIKTWAALLEHTKKKEDQGRAAYADHPHLLYRSNTFFPGASQLQP